MKKKLLNSMRVLLVAALLGGASSAWAQFTTFDFTNSTVWGSVTLPTAEAPTVSYDATGVAATTGNYVTFYSKEAKIVHATTATNGIGFSATGSTSDNYVKINIPAGYKASVTAYVSSNRNVQVKFGEKTETFSANWSEVEKIFDNSEGLEAVDLYIYCSANYGGAGQAPYLRKIILTDMSAVSAYSWSANAVTTIGSAKTTIKTYSSSEDVPEGSSYTVVVDKVIKYNDEYYALNEASFAENIFGKTYTMGNANAVHEINYTKIDNVAFYGEAEDIYSSGSSANKDANNSLLSNGSGYYAQATSGYVTLSFNVPENALYTIVLGMNNTNNKSRGFNYSIDGADVSETITVNASTAYVQNITNQFLAAGDHTIQLNCTYSLTPVFDYLLVIRTGDPIQIATITDAGWATLYTPYALDFTTQPGITAYTAAVADGKVTLTKVDNVPANTGVVLKGDGPNYYQINVAASSATAKGDLLGSATDATAYNAIDGYTLYMLKKVGEKAQFVPVTGGEIAAGKAYLKVANATTARNLDVTFADEATGIESVKSEEIKVKSEVYNLKGQRVSEPTKGLYIVNGKKIAIK